MTERRTKETKHITGIIKKTFLPFLRPNREERGRVDRPARVLPLVRVRLGGPLPRRRDAHPGALLRAAHPPRARRGQQRLDPAAHELRLRGGAAGAGPARGGGEPEHRQRPRLAPAQRGPKVRATLVLGVRVEEGIGREGGRKG